MVQKVLIKNKERIITVVTLVVVYLFVMGDEPRRN